MATAWFEPSSAGSLLQQYSPDGKGARRRGNATTRSAMLRANCIRLNCYLNCEGVGVTHLGGPAGHSTIVKLPEECDTMDEVLIKIQARLHLDERMLYASELYDVQGMQITSISQLAQLAMVDAPIIVGCGEPFDGTRIPQDLVEFHKEGGGRQGPLKVHKTLREKRIAALKEKADKVRESGHGINSEAVALARVQNIEMNRDHVHEMRHKYMESLLIRAAQQEDLMQSVKANTEIHRMEAAESKARQHERALEKKHQLAVERRQQKLIAAQNRQELNAAAREKADRVRSGSPKRPKSPSGRAKSARPVVQAAFSSSYSWA